MNGLRPSSWPSSTASGGAGLVAANVAGFPLGSRVVPAPWSQRSIVCWTSVMIRSTLGCSWCSARS
jgi:hypothetical protein